MALVHVVDRRKRRGFPGRRSPHRAVGHVALGSSWPADRGRPCRRSRRRWSSAARMAKREQRRESGRQDAWSERPATRHGRPLADPRGEGGRAV